MRGVWDHSTGERIIWSAIAVSSVAFVGWLTVMSCNSYDVREQCDRKCFPHRVVSCRVGGPTNEWGVCTCGAVPGTSVSVHPVNARRGQDFSGRVK